MIYTAIFGKVSKLGLVYKLNDPVHPDGRCEYVCFTDHENFTSNIWRIVRDDPPGDQRLRAKVYKMLPHKYFPNEVSLWVDGAITITSEDIYGFIQENINKSKWSLFLNPYNKSVEELMNYLIESKRIDAETVRKQYEEYLNGGFPNGVRPIKGGVLLRKTHDKEVIRFNEEWWKHNLRYCSWDEMSFPYVAWKLGWKLGQNYQEFGYSMYENKHFNVPQLG